MKICHFIFTKKETAYDLAFRFCNTSLKNLVRYWYVDKMMCKILLSTLFFDDHEGSSPAAGTLINWQEALILLGFPVFLFT